MAVAEAKGKQKTQTSGKKKATENPAGRSAGKNKAGKQQTNKMRMPFASVVAICVLCLILITVTVNAVFVNRLVDRLTDMAEALPSSPEEQDTEKLIARINELADLLAAHEKALNLSVSFQLIDRAHELTDQLKAYAATHEAGNYAATRESLLDALDDLKRLEKIGAENIL